jgi:hypothetical protein
MTQGMAGEHCDSPSQLSHLLVTTNALVLLEMTKAVDLLRHIQRLALPDGDLLQLQVEEKILVRELGQSLTEQVKLSKCGVERLEHLRKRHTLL